MAVDHENDELVPVAVLRAERAWLQQTLARLPYNPAPDLRRLADERRDAQRRLVSAGRERTRVQEELNELPLIARLCHREHRGVLQHGLNHLDREMDAQKDRLRLLQRQRNDLRPSEKAWRTWHDDHKPDLDRLATLRLHISLAENLRPGLAQAEQAPAHVLELQPEPGAMDLSV